MAKNILVYSPGSLGDTLMICPALTLIKKNHPTDRISMLSDLPVGRSKLTPCEILDGTELIDSFIEYRAPRSDNLFEAVFAVLKVFFSLAGRFDTVYYLVECWKGERRVTRDRIFFKLCGIAELKYFDRLQPKPKTKAESISRACEALYRAGDDLALEYLSKDMTYLYEARPRKPGVGCNLSSSNYILSPFSNMPAKDWSEDRYVLIARWLNEKFSFNPIIFGSEDDTDRADQLISQIGSGQSFCGHLSFFETKQKLRACAFYFGNDSGLMHLGAAVGLPCFSIFSARDFRGRWFPLGPSHINLRRYDMDCEGCREPVCRGPVYNDCLASIGVKFCQQKLEAFIGGISRGYL